MTAGNRQKTRSNGNSSRAPAAAGDNRTPAPASGEEIRIPASEAGAVRGGVTIAESVVEMVAATASREVPGIYPASGPDGIASEVTRAFGVRQGPIRARIKHGREVRLEMKMAVDYGEHMPTRGEEVRVAVARAVRKLTDLEPGEIKIKVTDVISPKVDEPEVEQAKGVQPEAERQEDPAVEELMEKPEPAPVA
jgi:uncharacterized alkaline shock family protein YloU